MLVEGGFHQFRPFLLSMDFNGQFITKRKFWFTLDKNIGTENLQGRALCSAGDKTDALIVKKDLTASARNSLIDHLHSPKGPGDAFFLLLDKRLFSAGVLFFKTYEVAEVCFQRVNAVAYLMTVQGQFRLKA